MCPSAAVVLFGVAQVQQTQRVQPSSGDRQGAGRGWESVLLSARQAPNAALRAQCCCAAALLRRVFAVCVRACVRAPLMIVFRSLQSALTDASWR